MSLSIVHFTHTTNTDETCVVAHDHAPGGGSVQKALQGRPGHRVLGPEGQLCFVTMRCST